MTSIKAHPGLIAGFLAGLALPASGATVVFDIAPASSPLSSALTIQTGSDLDYVLTAVVLSDDAGQDDNSGLAGFDIDIETNLGVAQQAATSFDLVIEQNFTVGLSLGSVVGDDILQITGEQPASTDPRTGVAQGDVLELASGTLITPSTEDTFTVSISSDSLATVFKTSVSTLPNTESATVLIGEGFTITTDDDAEPDPGAPGNGAGDTTTCADDVQTVIIATGALLLITGAGYCAGGLLGLVIGLLVGSIGGLAILGVNPLAPAASATSAADVPGMEPCHAVAAMLRPDRDVLSLTDPSDARIHAPGRRRTII